MKSALKSNEELINEGYKRFTDVIIEISHFLTKLNKLRLLTMTLFEADTSEVIAKFEKDTADLDEQAKDLNKLVDLYEKWAIAHPNTNFMELEDLKSRIRTVELQIMMAKELFGNFAKSNLNQFIADKSVRDRCEAVKLNLLGGHRAKDNKIVGGVRASFRKALDRFVASKPISEMPEAKDLEMNEIY